MIHPVKRFVQKVAIKVIKAIEKTLKESEKFD